MSAESVEAFGLDVLADLRRYLAGRLVGTILDVGANEGQSLIQFRDTFPDAQIHCLEPSPDAFEILQKTAARFSNVYLYDYGFADRPGVRDFHMSLHSCLNSILPSGEEYAWPAAPLSRRITSRFETLDWFLSEAQIETVDILKIDVQGAEMLVLEGGKQALAGGAVRSVKLEICFLALYEGQASLDQIFQFISKHGFLFTGLYGQFYEEYGRLCWCDALFIHHNEFSGKRSPQFP
jgi:FkbM family methyltransferase